MKAWIVREVVGYGTGLGKKDVLVVPLEDGGALLVSLVVDGRVWIEKTDKQVPPKSDDYHIDEVEMSTVLAAELRDISFGDGNIAQETKDRLFTFARRPATAKKSILFACDQIELFERLVFHLKENGFKVIVVKDGIEAMQSAQQNQPDLMLIQILLPGCNGYEVSRMLKERMEKATIRAFPIILLSANKIESRDREKFIATWSRADSHIRIPCEAEEILARIREYLA